MDKNPITAEEYQAAIKEAKWIADEISSLNVFYKRMARVLLALSGAWEEVPEDCRACDSTGDRWFYSNGERSGDCEDCMGTGNVKNAIAARHGLPVGRFPCPECGGSKRIVSQIEIEPILTDAGCIGAKRTPTFVPCPECGGRGKVSIMGDTPCPACQGERR